MSLPDLELLLRGAAAALAFACAIVLAARSPRSLVSSLAAFCSGGVGAFVLVSWQGSLAALGFLVFALDFWCLASPFAFWLLARALFEDDFRPRRGELALIALLIAASGAADWGRFRLGPLGFDPAFAAAAFIVLRAVSAVLLAHALFRVGAGWRADLVEARRRARPWAVAIVGGVFAATVTSSFVFPFGAPDSVRIPALALLTLGMLAWTVLVGSGALHAALSHAGEAVRIVVRPRTVAGEGEADRDLAARVQRAMRHEALWRRDDLSLGFLARHLAVPEYRLRRAIHGRLGARNFNAFVAGYRLEAASARLGDRAGAATSVLAVALDCGFGSIGPFNRAFKARYGTTPTAYRAQALAENSNRAIIPEFGETAAR
jgi:AraC-like DNA-binding protein